MGQEGVWVSVWGGLMISVGGHQTRVGAVWLGVSLGMDSGMGVYMDISSGWEGCVGYGIGKKAIKRNVTLGGGTVGKGLRVFDSSLFRFMRSAEESGIYIHGKAGYRS